MHFAHKHSEPGTVQNQGGEEDSAASCAEMAHTVLVSRTIRDRPRSLFH